MSPTAAVTLVGGVVRYTPAPNFFGTDTFTYTVSDGNGGTDTATVTITVTDVPDNTPPVANDDTVSVLAGSSSNVINVLANDTDADAGQTLVVSAITQPANGSVVNNGGSVSYTPNGGFIGTDTFTYTVSDGNGGTDTATVTVIVNQPAGQLLINEIEIDPPSNTSDACQYLEIRGQNPGGVIPAGTYFASINSDLNGFGSANLVLNLSGLTLGPNGTLTLVNTVQGACPGRTYDPGTNLVTYNSNLLLGGGGAQTSGSETFLLFQATGTINSAQDLDADDDGLFDAFVGLTTIFDGFALLVNPDEEYVYGQFDGFAVENISDASDIDQPDAVTRFAGNNVPFSATSFFFGELAASPDATNNYAAPLSGNFPVGGLLTPGGLNQP